MIQLGSKYTDAITGFTGIATSRHHYLYGCVRVCLEPDCLRDGKPPEAQTFDEQRLSFVESFPVHFSEESDAKTGGPGDIPAARSIPSAPRI